MARLKVSETVRVKIIFISSSLFLSVSEHETSVYLVSDSLSNYSMKHQCLHVLLLNTPLMSASQLCLSPASFFTTFTVSPSTFVSECQHRMMTDDNWFLLHFTMPQSFILAQAMVRETLFLTTLLPKILLWLPQYSGWSSGPLINCERLFTLCVQTVHWAAWLDATGTFHRS